MIDWWSNASDRARFEAKFMRGAPDQCWEWKAGKQSDGYGTFQMAKRAWLAHRLALALALGRPLERAELALHSCDNPPCVNPSHLRIGTDADNMRDRDERERRRPPKGIRNGRALLTNAEVLAIRELCADPLGPTHVEIAKHFQVSKTTVSHIQNRRTWSHL